ncbi:GtrA family protein [Gilvimarinus sp. DA14]|uniref:GtrA family protein n=1 Tax=Gilvimarinus sp. DA14 TaxID=2956798 RepID=UPI0020B8C7F0|nr:GtrA family protein [Gilvimarinus sp. DA14]UTF58988.1 GtrA family protein [Gilvimarinus sp. DA14]
MPSLQSFTHSLPQLSRFAVTGALLGATDLSLFAALAWLGVPVQWANVAGLVVGYALGLVLHHSFTFRCEAPLNWAAAQKYLLIFSLSLMLGSGVFTGLLALSFLPLTAKLGAMAAVAVSNFTLGRRFVFDL